MIFPFVPLSDESKALERAMSGFKIYLENQRMKKASEQKAISFMSNSRLRSVEGNLLSSENDFFEVCNHAL